MITYEDFESLTKKHIPHNASVVLGFSGGVDSCVLVTLFDNFVKKNKKFNLTVKAVYIDHGLSKKSVQWEKFCYNFCKTKNITFYSKKILLNKESNIEANARHKRYEALQSFMNDGDYLVTGHHANDQVETLFLSLKRASGPRGLSGMSIFNKRDVGYHFRPLLKYPKDAILEFAQTYNLKWVEDESNESVKFDRNFIRKDIVPRLSERWSNFQSSALISMKLCSKQDSLLQELVEEKINFISNSGKALSIEKLKNMSEELLLYTLKIWVKKLSNITPSSKGLNTIIKDFIFSKHDSNPIYKIGDYQVRKFQFFLYIIPDYKDLTYFSTALKINEKIHLPHNYGQITIISNPKKNILRFPDKLEYPLRITFCPPKGLIYPNGKTVGKKFKKWAQEYNIPSWERKRLPFLYYGNSLAAIVGLFVCTNFSGQDLSIDHQRLDK
ncbi:tRNA lysidine(34) synthetase TilS [Paraphotobacterium marinum]|uniref:tRNA(Ile)-lysidine synthase n=1 Tax=Paraphotobacterium marinum TaxID=1755811 RepID=A0A220VBU5_9GAMM|nr:tRNA lysidine(34) synthetase TilS [Paraphotobacterium marinum]ASK77809.1 tRNA lysidine(34) synthetase TilS [Paraphotobacterium marinum]